MIPNIPQSEVIRTNSINKDPNYKGLRIVRYQTDLDATNNFRSNRYQFQSETHYTIASAVLARKGAVRYADRFRLVAIIHPTLRDFVNIVKYDPADPAPEKYDHAIYRKAHEQTQSDFKGQKKQNKADFMNYLLDGSYGDRTLYLPTISGWQAEEVFDDTVFVAFDEENPNALYGRLYLPKKPIMQADGQTQTAALFSLFHTKDVSDLKLQDDFTVTLEIELKINEGQAGQSFADRNGRGSKKNKNLVIGLDISSALSKLRYDVTSNTVFEKRLAQGRTTATTETATTAIVDLSTMEQLMLYVISDNRLKPENIKSHHLNFVQPYAKEFVNLLDELFAEVWVQDPGKKQDPFRRIYVHGWPFALKALASAYHRTKIDELGPIAQAIMREKRDTRPGGLSAAEAFEAYLKEEKDKNTKQPIVPFDELKKRLEQIDWLRYRKHWIAITGAKMQAGKKRLYTLRSTGEAKVHAQAQNTSVVIDAVRDKILSSTWAELTSKIDDPLP